MSDPVARAYAQLGVPPGTSPPRLRRQYRALVRKWHPDRFVNDPRGQAEATARMREINAAYHVILQSGAPPVSSVRGASGRHAESSRGPLTRDEIERMVQAIGSAGPVETLLDALRSVGSGIWMVGVVGVVVLSIRLLLALHDRDWAAIRSEPRMMIYPVLAGVGLLAWYWRERQPPKE